MEELWLNGMVAYISRHHERRATKIEVYRRITSDKEQAGIRMSAGKGSRLLCICLASYYPTLIQHLSIYNLCMVPVSLVID